MTLHYLWYSAEGPKMYDDTSQYPPESDYAGENREGALLSGQARVESNPTHVHHVVRKEDLDWALPVGSIMMWSGSAAALAALTSKWQLCDGTNGTPDLRDKFVMCAGSSYAIGATGGNDKHQHDAAGGHLHEAAILTLSTEGGHTHASDGAHTHGSGGAHTHSGSTSLFYPTSGDFSTGATIRNYHAPSSHSHTFTISSSGSHTHASDGGHTHDAIAGHTHTDASGHTHDEIEDHQHPEASHMPPYYALAYIMKIAAT